MVTEAKGKIFYGYWVVVGAWIAMLVCSGAQFSIGIFMPALITEFGWTRTSISTGLTLSLIIMPIAGLGSGYLVDKIGPRLTVIIGSVIGAFAMFLLSQISQIWHFIVVYGIFLAAGLAMSYVVPNVATVRRWFMKRAALMVAVALTGGGLGVVFLVPVAQILIRTFGWRGAYIAFGIILLAGGIIGGLLLKKDPESEGTYPDGEKPDEEMMKVRADYLTRAEKWSVADAFKTSSWWQLNIAQMGYILAIVGLLGHMVTWGTLDLQIPKETVVKIFSFAFVMSSVIGRLVAGFSADWLMSRFGMTRKPLLYFCIFGVAAGMFLCPYVKDAQSLFWASILLGFSYGSGVALFPVYLGDLFGVANIPVLLSYVVLSVSIFGAIGPILFGMSYDRTHSYDMAFMISGILCVISGIFFYLLKPPKKAAA